MMAKGKIIKLTEIDLRKLVKNVIKESHQFDDEVEYCEDCGSERDEVGHCPFCYSVENEDTGCKNCGKETDADGYCSDCSGYRYH